MDEKIKLPDTFYKYLAVSPFDEQWGFCVVDAGSALIPPESDYPLHQHPDSHRMPWATGRRLHQFHILFIAEGGGYLQTESAGNFELSAGAMVLLYPGEWHRYRPHANTGWHEYWIGFDGHFAEHLMTQTRFSELQPCLHIGMHTDILHLFQEVLMHIAAEDLGYQQTISALTMQILGRAAALQKFEQFQKTKVDAIIQQSKVRIQTAVCEPFDPKKLAEELNVGYSWFRRMFKIYTDFSPLQYHLELKIRRAKHLLCTTNLPVKTIAFNLSFKSNYYFSRIFKNKTGLTPTEFREQSR